MKSKNEKGMISVKTRRILLSGLLALSMLLTACTSMQTHETPKPVQRSTASADTTTSAVTLPSPTAPSEATTKATTTVTTQTSSVTTPPTTTETSATDPPEGEISRAVEAAARTMLNRSYDWIDAENLSEMKYLEIVFDAERTDWEGALNGLEYCTELKTLSIRSYQGESLKFLYDLPQLETLSIDFGVGNLASEYEYDLTPITHLHHLKRLELTNCSALDLTAIGSMTWLEELWLTGDAIDDLTPLAGLTNLRGLSLGHFTAHGANMVTDLSPLSEMKQLEFLHLVYCGGNLSAIQKLPIRSLVISFCGVSGYDRLPITVESLLITDSGFVDSDVKQLNKLEKLEYLVLGEPVSNAATLRSRGLKGFYNGGDELSDDFWAFPGENNSLMTRFGMLRDPVSEGLVSTEMDLAVKNACGREAGEALLADLETLDVHFAFDKTDWSDDAMRGIEYCTGVRSLRIERYQGSDVEFLHGLPELEELTLDLVQPGFAEMPLGTEYDLTPLKTLKKLRSLTISGPVLDMDLIGSLTTLEALELGTCWYENDDLSPLGGLKNLRKLNISPNNWWDLDLSALAGLKHLTGLELTYYQGSLAFLRDLPIETLLLRDAGVQDYDDLPESVKTLMLWWIDFDPADLPKLQRLTHLKTILLPEQFDTPEARAALPGVEWVADGYYRTLD